MKALNSLQTNAETLRKQREGLSVKHVTVVLMAQARSRWG